MKIFKTQKKLKKHLKRLRKSGQSIGFVPTMGALHMGHMSLIKQANTQCDVSVASIFVNPTQFNDSNDFDKYPRTTGKDINMLEDSACQILYLPKVKDLYDKKEKAKNYELGKLEHILEGEFRTGHFQGVATIVHKLLKVVKPNNLFLGQKDFQQVAVIRKMIELVGLDVLLVPCETVREEDGLAMSSRNQRLSVEARAIAPEIFLALNHIKNSIHEKPFSLIIEEAIVHLSRHPIVRVEYLKIVDRNTLEIVEEWNVELPILACISAWYGEIRLIDNLFLN